MKPQFENNLMSSLLFYLDHMVLKEGEAFTNYSGLFYPINNTYSSYYTYSAPFKQIVADSSISGCNIMSGIYLGGSFITGGQSGLTSINHVEGQVIFNAQKTSQISGRYAVKDFNFYLSSQPEEELMLETKYSLRPKVSQVLTGLAETAQTYPSVYIKNIGGDNRPYAFGGQDLSYLQARAIVLSDSSFKLDAINSIFRDLNQTRFGIFERNDFPFDAFGGTKSGYYNYDSLNSNVLNQGKEAFIKNVYVSKAVPPESYKNNFNKEVCIGYVDFDIETVRYPRI
jgi:hypothetical protein